MKLTHQLHLDALGKAAIQFTIAWEDNRLRLGTGGVVKLLTLIKEQIEPCKLCH